MRCLIGLVAVGCSAPETPAVAPVVAIAADAAVIDATPSCVDDGAPYDEATLRAHLARLAAPDLDGRAPGSPGDRAARAYIAERFRCLGLQPGGDDGSYEQRFLAGGHWTANVIGYLPGADPAVGAEIIAVGAHHDHLGGGLLGANDNASGVAGLLAIAQAMRQRPAPRRTIAFITFGGEERGLLGSSVYVRQRVPALPLEQTVQLVNLDMIGSYAARDIVHAFGAFAGMPARRLLATLDDAHPRLRVRLGGHSVRGDHARFCERGVPYVFFWTPDPRCYHRPCDTIEHLDVRNLTAITALAGALTAGLADTELDLAAVRARRGCGAR